MTDRWERYSALATVPAVILWVLGIILMEGVAGSVPEEGADEILAYYQDNENAILAGSWVFMVGSLCFLWFVGCLRTFLRRWERGDGTFSAIAFAGGIVTAAFAIGIPGGGVAAALAADELTPAAAEALSGVTTAAFVGAELAAIVLLVATALVAFLTGALPRWWAIVSVLIAIVLVIGPIGWLGLLIGVPVWALVTSFFVYSRPGVPDRTAVAPAA